MRSKILTSGRITILLGKYQASTGERMSPRKLAEKAGVPNVWKRYNGGVYTSTKNYPMRHISNIWLQIQAGFEYAAELMFSKPAY